MFGNEDEKKMLIILVIVPLTWIIIIITTTCQIKHSRIEGSILVYNPLSNGAALPPSNRYNHPLKIMKFYLKTKKYFSQHLSITFIWRKIF